MSGLIGVNHVATVTTNLDGLIDFYDRIFDAKCLFDEPIPFMTRRSSGGSARHAFISLGGPALLHAWQVDGVDPSQFDGEIFERGRVDHFALATKSYADFERLRARLVDEEATSGEVTDFGVMISFSFQDPDGLWAEVSWWKDGPDLASFDASLVRDPIGEREPRHAE